MRGIPPYGVYDLAVDAIYAIWLADCLLWLSGVVRQINVFVIIFTFGIVLFLVFEVVRVAGSRKNKR